MKLSDVGDIWSVDVACLSKRDAGMVFFSRCQLLVAEAIRSRKLPVKDRRIDREWLQRQIGCKAAALRQNVRIRQYLDEKDKLVSLSPDTTFQSRSVQSYTMVADDDQQFVSQFVGGKIVETTVTYEGGVYVVPVLHWYRRIDEEVSDWLRDLALDHSVSITSLREYAKTLRDFMRFRRRMEVLWDEVTDQTIIAWRNRKKGTGRQIRHINDYTDRVFAFYVWAEETGRLEDHVQLGPRTNAENSPGNKRYLITSKPVGKEGRRWSYKLRDSPANYGRKHTPTKQQVQDLHNAILDDEHAERNSLLFVIAEQAATRRFEVLQLRLGHLPTPEERDRLIETGGVWPINIIRKRGKPGTVYLLPDVLRRLDLFIKYERRQIVERCEKENKIVSDHIFITNEGTVLTPGALTDLARKVFKKAKVANSSYHRLRARNAEDNTQTGIAAVQDEGLELGPGMHWNRTILVRVADILGHANTQNLEHYIDEGLNSLIQRSKAQKKQDLGHAIAEKERIIEGLDRRIALRIKLLEIIGSLTTKASKSQVRKIDEVVKEIMATLQI
jgi:site-specific recombinase XerD